jgi:FAD:protein FMN transferase
MPIRFLIIAALYVFQKSDNPAIIKDYIQIQGNAQGTTYSISYDGKQSAFTKKQADSIFNVIDLSMSLWDPNSLISKFNQNQEIKHFDEHFLAVFQKSKAIHKLSHGAFDPTIAPIIKAYGFVRKNGLQLPSEHTIDSLRQFVGFEKVYLSGNSIRKKAAGVQLDFNAIAQGYTVDVLAEFLEKKDIQNYLIEVGGEVRAKGKNSRGKTWKIGIENPKNTEDERQDDFLEILTLKNMSLATSGNYRNFVKVFDKKIGHILDPRTGQPADHNLVSVSVMAPSCMEADAWATAFMVMGLEKSWATAKDHHLDIQLVFAEDGVLKSLQSKGFRKALR